jgi:bifunctional DNase/RNase
MTSDLIPIAVSKVMQSKSYTVIILGDESKKFAIYTEPQVGKNLQIFLTQGKRQRPSTYDLIENIFKGCDIEIVQIVIQDVEDTTYFARLFLEVIEDDKKNILEVDARPSDCITLSLMNNIPIYCRKSVYEKVIPVTD